MTCLEIDQLEQFLSGELDDYTSRSVEEHIASCPACEARADETANLRRR